MHRFRRVSGQKWYFLSGSGLFTLASVAHGSSAFFSRVCRREAEERGGAAAGDQGLLREERDRAGSEAGAEEQRPPTGLAAERTGRATQTAAEMRRQLVYLPDATDIAVADADPLDAALLLGLVS